MLLEPGSSRILRAWLVVIHVVAIILLPFLSLPVEAGLIMLVLIFFSLWQAIRPRPDSITAVRWNEARCCRLSLASGQGIEARLMPQVFMLPWLVIMRFKSDRKRLHHLVLLPDMLEPGIFRRLRVRLMIEQSGSPDEAQRNPGP